MREEGRMSVSRMGVAVFCAYASSDEEYGQQLENHLSTLPQQGVITFWHDQQIRPGDNLKDTITTHISQASIILLLVSDDFIASDFCAGPEMKRVFQRHEQGEVRVVPVIIRPCDWRDLPL